MKIFRADQVREIDAYTIEKEPIESIDLMERAASKLVKWYLARFGIEKHIYLFAGPGNNGGDALAMARMLAERQYSISCFLVSSSGNLSKDCKLNLQRLEELRKIKIINVREINDVVIPAGPGVIIDGLFGSGLSRSIEGLYKEIITLINASALEVVSIDIPSGLFGEDNTMNDSEGIVRADYTVSFQFPFLAFMFRENEVYTGEWYLADIGLHPDIIQSKESDYFLLERKMITAMLRQRPRFAHKGTFGHALLIAGSYGMTGAAVLAGEAALRSGCGLVTAHVPSSSYTILQSTLPEVIVSLDQAENCFSNLPDLSLYSAIGIGPGLGKNKQSVFAFNKLLETAAAPLVIDADALNILGEHKDMVKSIPKGSIITPHPKEFDRIFGPSASCWERHIKQKQASGELGIVIVLKGAYTGISLPSGEYFFNATGNPGMATGGSGDVLTGIISGLLAQGLSPESAAVSGVFIHGIAGDLAKELVGEDALIAGDIIKALGKAFIKVRKKPFLHEGRTGGVVQ